MQRGGTPAANVAPSVMPPFLKHIPEFRRLTYKSKYLSKKPQILPITEVQPGVACGGCVEP